MKELDFTKPLKTKRGESVQVLTTTSAAVPERPVVVEITDGVYRGITYRVTKEGQTGTGPSYLDLVQAPEKIHCERWVNVYADGTLGGPWTLLKEAQKVAGTECLGQYKIVIDTDTEKLKNPC